MKPSQATTASLVLILIGALVLLGMNLLNPAKGDGSAAGGFITLPDSSTLEPTAIPVLLPDAQLEVVTVFKITDHVNDRVFSASTNKDGTWRITRAPKGVDTSLIADGGRISSAVTGLPALVPSRVLSGIEDLTTFGLGEGKRSYTLEMTIGNGNYTLWIGDQNPGETGYYTQLKDKSDVYLIPTYALSSIIGLLDNPPLVTATPSLEMTPTVGVTPTP
jgi:hypothetical protein